MSQRSFLVELLEACFWLSLVIGSLYSLYLMDQGELPWATVKVSQESRTVLQSNITEPNVSEDCLQFNNVTVGNKSLDGRCVDYQVTVTS